MTMHRLLTMQPPLYGIDMVCIHGLVYSIVSPSRVRCRITAGISRLWDPGRSSNSSCQQRRTEHR